MINIYAQSFMTATQMDRFTFRSAPQSTPEARRARRLWRRIGTKTDKIKI